MRSIPDTDVDYLTARCEIRRARILTEEQAQRETQEMEAVAIERAARAEYQTITTIITAVVIFVICILADVHSMIAALFA